MAGTRIAHIVALAATLALVALVGTAARAQDLPSILTLLGQGFEIRAAYQGSIVLQRGKELFLCGVKSEGGLSPDAYIASYCVPFKDKRQ
jgi:hypothetical protein